MTVFQVDIEKSYQGLEYWTNVYHVQATDLSDASAKGSEIAVIELANYFQPVTITKIRASTVPVDTGQFITLTTNLVPTTPAPGDGLMPLFVCARVDFSTAIGRPARKFLRAVLTQGDTPNGVLPSTVVAGINDNYSTPMVALGYLCKVNGDLVTGGACSVNASDRQLRRGSKRKGPIIP